ncbi:hypothetical protein NFI96_032705, partial [Prochilodus magdalenae]
MQEEGHLHHEGRRWRRCQQLISYSSTFLERITEHIRKKHEEDQSDVMAAMKYILSNIILSNKDETSEVLQTLTDLRATLWRFVEEKIVYQSPEFFLLVLLLFWPDENQHQCLHYNVDLNTVVENMKTAFNRKYQKHFRSRYLRPLFFLGQDTGLKRLVHSWKIYDLGTKHRNIPKQERKTWASLDWGNGKLWQHSSIQHLLFRVYGVFRKQQLFACVDGQEIAIYSDQAFVSYQGPVSFFLGFTIRGPMAYDIRLSVAPGRYECRVTGLCWECSSEAELEYLLSDWEDVGEFLEQTGFQPCGPLLDVTLVSGELTAVRLPHFLCLGKHASGSSPSLSDAVRVLHVEEAGVSIEPCQLSCHSAGLLHSRFSPRGVLVRTGFSVKAHCEVLIYCTLTAHLTLHVYLVPCDAKMIESVQKQEISSIRILKPHPDISLQMKNRYTLSTSCSSTITPQKLKLRYNSQTPNYFEVYIKDGNDDFQLRLTSEEEEPLWKADIRSAEYSRSLSCGDERTGLSRHYGFVLSTLKEQHLGNSGTAE